MKAIAEALAFSVLVAATVWLEVTGHQVGGLWAGIALWIIFVYWLD